MSLLELLAHGADETVAIAAVEQATPLPPALTFAGLRALVASTVSRLNELGIGRGDRVAMVLPNGPEMAASFVCIATGAATAPLNPGYRADELEFYLTDLRVKALVIERGMESPARDVAKKFSIPILELVPHRERGAGSFTLEPLDAAAFKGPSRLGGAGADDDEALLLHTSGTTARPKLVPLLQRNLLASVRHIRETLSIGPGDVCLNIMPLFHIHGLIAAVLVSLSAGGAVVCTPGFNPLKFFAWLEEAKPTRYTSVPTMHQALLSRAARNPAIIERSRLRLIRSSSAALPPQVMADLESTFRCPVIESYGMTEAAHQMTSNPLPPRARKPGFVGIAAGPDVAIMDGEGTLLSAGAIGEVVIRGPNVTPGYEGNPDANQKAFTNGWFRTGDQGVLDDEGYLRLTGRLKELINRAGEKISPLEVDNALMDHPAVQQCVTFAVPHDKLGEDVAAAVVLREGQIISERELRQFAALRLAGFKVPRKILLLAEIPKGPTGKLQRIGLAQKLGLAGGAHPADGPDDPAR